MKRVKMGRSALFLVGSIYTGLGGFFMVLGTLIGCRLKQAVFLVAFGGIGGLFFVLGLILLGMEVGKQRRNRALVAAGRYVWGEITACEPVRNIEINGRHPYVALVRYVDGGGTIHIFKSGSVTGYLPPDLLHRQVKVYADDNLRHAYVALEDILPQIIEH